MKWLIADTKDFTKEQYFYCLNLMPQDRQKYLLSVKNERRRLTSVCAQYHLIKLVEKLSGKNAADIVVLRDEKGKPYLKDLPIFVSISHSDGIVAVAADDKPIGIDIEKIKNRDLKLCRKFCDDSEASIIKNSQSPMIDFYKIWTAKEAYFKMLGTGIVNLKSVSYEDIPCAHFFENGFIITIAN